MYVSNADGPDPPAFPHTGGSSYMSGTWYDKSLTNKINTAPCRAYPYFDSSSRRASVEISRQCVSHRIRAFLRIVVYLVSIMMVHKNAPRLEGGINPPPKFEGWLKFGSSADVSFPARDNAQACSMCLSLLIVCFQERIS